MKLLGGSTEAVVLCALVVSGLSLAWQIIAVIASIAGKIAKPRLAMRINDAVIELGYYAIGPAFPLRLSFVSEKKQAFIEKIEAVLKNKTTNEQHVLVPRSVMEYRRNPVPNDMLPRLEVREPFSPFSVTTDFQETAILLFWDPQSAEEINTELNKVNAAYSALKRTNPSGIPDEFLDSFNNSPLIHGAWERIKEILYLKPGGYSVTVRTYFNDRFIESDFDFEIAQNDYDALKNNAVSMTRVPRYNEPPLFFQFVMPKIQLESTIEKRARRA